ncbi:hypothetical protein ACI784_08825 [Geodermatophilus sp. SYSU D01186]
MRALWVRYSHEPSVAASTVEAATRHWGFTHRGRFVARYRDRYGVQPAEILRRRP